MASMSAQPLESGSPFLPVRALTVVEENARLGLTPAELRLLPLLATHLSFREIAERTHVSPNTVKTQAISVYRKLGVSSRSEAVRIAEELGLIEAAEAQDARLELGEPTTLVAL